MNTAMVSLTFEILWVAYFSYFRIILTIFVLVDYKKRYLKILRLKNILSVCLFFKHMNLSMLINFMLIKKECKCLNIFEWLEVVKKKKIWSSFLPCFTVSRQYLGKKTQIEKKNTFEYLSISTDLETVCINCSWYMIYGNLTNTHQIESIILSKISSYVVCIISNFFV